MPSTREAALRGAGLRVTVPRTLVLDVLADRPHSDADTIRVAAQQSFPNLSAQAVYGVLKALVAAGLARRFEPAGGAAATSCGSATTTIIWSAGPVGPSSTWTAPWEQHRASHPRTRRPSRSTRPR